MADTGIAVGVDSDICTFVTAVVPDSQTTIEMIEGGCLCGEVRYAIDGEIGQVSHCHCSMCRRIHGAAFGSYGAVPKENFRWVSGTESVKTYPSSGTLERTFCSNCGSTLQAILLTEPDVVYAALGALDGDPKLESAIHIFVGSKAPWHEITDDLPQYDTWTFET